MKKIEIHFLVGDINIKGGVEKVTQVLSYEFLKLDAHIVIHSLYSKKSEAQLSQIKVIHHGLTPPDVEMNRFNKLKRILINGLFIRRNIKAKSGIAIFQGFYVATYLIFIKNFKKIVCEHNTYKAPSRGSQIVRYFIYSFFSPELVVLTEADKKHYKTLGIRKVRKIYNPAPYKNVTTHKDYTRKVIISLGRFTYQKRFDLMITQCASVLKEFPEWKLKIQGEGEDLYKMKQAIKRHGLDSQVYILSAGDPTPLYQEGSIFLMSSLFEGLPMTLIEAMSFSIPVVAYNCSPGLSEIIKDESNGFLIPMHDEEAYVEKVKELIKNSSLRKSMGQNAKIFSQNFEPERIIHDWRGLIL